MSKLVRKTLSDVRVDAARQRRLTRLAAQPDSAIDCSDIPELPPAAWAHAERNPFYRPVKQQLTVRLDADVVAWLRKQSGPDGRGYQTRLNALLRALMLRDHGKKSA